MEQKYKLNGKYVTSSWYGIVSIISAPFELVTTMGNSETLADEVLMAASR